MLVFIISHILYALFNSLYLLWEALFGLFIGFFLSAILQVFTPKEFIKKYMKKGIFGVIFSILLGIISSSCSYGAAELGKGLYKEGVDIKNVLSFLVSSTNMNIAILILFAYLLSWKFAFAEFFGGIIIIIFIIIGFSVFYKDEFKKDNEDIIYNCPVCGMEGKKDLSYRYSKNLYLFCSQDHKNLFKINPLVYTKNITAKFFSINSIKLISSTFFSDISMLKWELVLGFLIAGFAESFIPQSFFSYLLIYINNIPIFGYLLLLISGLLIAIITFVCSMGNVPIAKYLNSVHIPIGANITYIYGDLLILPLIRIYKKSYPKKIIYIFITFFSIGAIFSGYIMQILFRYLPNFPINLSPENLFFNVLNIISLILIFFLFTVYRFINI